MIRIFNRNRNAIGQFMAALIFLGTFGFLFMFDGFAAKSQASGCCGGGEAAVTTFAADSSGDFGSGLPMDAGPTGGCCSSQDKPIPSSSNNNGDGDGDGDCDCTCIEGGCGSCDENKCEEASHVDCEDGCGHTCPDDFHGCCSDKGTAYCPNDEFATKICCEAGDCGS